MLNVGDKAPDFEVLDHTGKTVTMSEFAGKTVVLLMSGPTVSALAGISGMRTAVFVPLATMSLVARMLALLFFADVLRSYLEIALAWIEAYWVPGTVVMVTLVGLYRWRRKSPATVLED